MRFSHPSIFSRPNALIWERDRDFQQLEARYLPNMEEHEKEFTRALVQAVSDAITEYCADTIPNACGDNRDIEIIPGIHLSGFIPHTDGGYQAIIPAVLDLAQSEEHPKIIDHYINQSLQDAERDFCDLHRIDQKASPNWFDTLEDHEREELGEMEDHYLREGGTYFYKVRAFKAREDGSIYFDCYLNTDFEYGRDFISWLGKDCTHGDYKRRFYPSPRLTEDNLEKICEQVRYEILSYIKTL